MTLLPRWADRVSPSVRIWALYAVGLVPAAWSFYLGATGQLPGNPVKTFEHLLGIWAIRFLLAALSVTPLRDLAGISLIRYRRALGLLAFWYVAMHFTTYMVLDQYLDFGAILNDIVKRPFITIGMACFTLLIPLALTSNSFSIRRLGGRWKTLHSLSYVIVLGAVLHYGMSLKVLGPEVYLYGALALLLVAYRFVRPRIMAARKRRVATAAG